MNRMENRLREIDELLSLDLESQDKNTLEKEKRELLNEFKKQGMI